MHSVSKKKCFKKNVDAFLGVNDKITSKYF